jgi:hypothetical protein
MHDALPLQQIQKGRAGTSLFKETRENHLLLAYPAKVLALLENSSKYLYTLIL